VKIYSDYDKEPEDHFLPLPEQLGCDFYNLEMDSWMEDISFYKNHLPARGLTLELGCGSGRLGRHLATKQRPFIGIDISLTALRRAVEQGQRHVRYAGMDMTRPGFTTIFSAVIAAYNTLNLLTSSRRIECCLKSCRELLDPGGRFLAQLFIPSEDLIAATRKIFQFQVFERPGGGRIIKEILKKYQPADQTVRIEERFRVRPMREGVANEDWNRVHSVAAFSRHHWLHLFSHAGFAIVNQNDTFPGRSDSTGNTSLLLVHLEL